MQRVDSINALQFRESIKLTPREVRLQHVMRAEPWKLTEADTTEDPAEYQRLTGSKTSACWLEYSNRERLSLEDPEWRMDEEWLRIFARMSSTPEERAYNLDRVERFAQHRIDWYVDAEEELVAWEFKVARIRGDYDEWYAAWDDAAKEVDAGGEVSTVMEEGEQASTELAKEGEGEGTSEAASPYRASRFLECIRGDDEGAGYPVRCVLPKKASRGGLFPKAWKKNIFRRVKETQVAYQVTLAKQNWYADGR